MIAPIRAGRILASSGFENNMMDVGCQVSFFCRFREDVSCAAISAIMASFAFSFAPPLFSRSKQVCTRVHFPIGRINKGGYF